MQYIWPENTKWKIFICTEILIFSRIGSGRSNTPSLPSQNYPRHIKTNSVNFWAVSFSWPGSATNKCSPGLFLKKAAGPERPWDRRCGCWKLKSRLISAYSISVLLLNDLLSLLMFASVACCPLEKPSLDCSSCQMSSMIPHEGGRSNTSSLGSTRSSLQHESTVLDDNDI